MIDNTTAAFWDNAELKRKIVCFEKGEIPIYGDARSYYIPEI